MVTKADIMNGLNALGVRPDTNIMIHSSLKSFGFVEGGAQTVVQAIMETVTDGVIVMPSFNHGAPYDSGAVFDIRSTPTVNGAIPECFRNIPGVERSMNPTHPFCIYGKGAKEIAAAHEKGVPMGEGSPLDWLYKHDGHVLLVGVDYTRNTFHHYVETMEGAHCLNPAGEEYDVIDGTGTLRRARTWSWRNGHCPVTDCGAYAQTMKPFEKKVSVGGSILRFFAMSDCYRVVSSALTCKNCEIMPRVCRYTVED